MFIENRRSYKFCQVCVIEFQFTSSLSWLRIVSHAGVLFYFREVKLKWWRHTWSVVTRTLAFYVMNCTAVYPIKQYPFVLVFLGNKLKCAIITHSSLFTLNCEQRRDRRSSAGKRDIIISLFVYNAPKSTSSDTMNLVHRCSKIVSLEEKKIILIYFSRRSLS